jgi:hypothetical protein
MRGKLLLLGVLGLVLVFVFSFGCGDDDTTPTPDSGTTTADSSPPQGDTGTADTTMPDGPASDGPSSDTTTATDGSTATFSAGVQPIFSASCAGASCHAGAAPKAGLSLSSGSAYAQLVGAASLQCNTLKRVEPGAPDQSYLVQKIEGAGSCFTGQKMPVGGSLSAAQISTIKGWITAGAKND